MNGISSDIVFSIENTGVGDLFLAGSSGAYVVLNGTNADQFSVVQTNVTSPIVASSNNTFTVTFSPTSGGVKTAKMTITSNDIDEATYTINLLGTGVRLSQSITFDALAAKTVGNADFDLSATASSGLAVTYTSSDVSVATVSGNIVTVVGAGSTEITASQAG
ncbi:choice-of-anchor D domain-containing protein, partial [Fulvivirga lutimaris]|nr:choice-of-anchor D domain-containing protein [Fulvivirga lutimaris]